MKHFLTIALTCLPLLCLGAPSISYTSYFNNTHTYTNATVAGTNFASRGVFTNSLSAAGFATSGTTNATLTGNLLANGATFTNGITAGASTFTGQIILPDGSAGTPSTGFTSESNTGPFRSTSNAYDISVAGTSRIRVGTESLVLRSGATLSWSSGAIGTATDTFLLRDGAANTLAMRNGANAQRLNVYGTYTDASNYEVAYIRFSGSTFRMGTTSAGTGTMRGLELETQGTPRWTINTSGHFLANTDNTYDIGASGATRPRNLYVAGFINVAGAITSAGVVAGAGDWFSWSGRGSIRASADGVHAIYNSAGNDYGRLQFGGTTASFPALKRSSTELQVRLADDSADAPLKSGALSNTGIRVMTPSSLQTLAAANALLANATKVRVVGSGGAVTLTSTPTIADGSDGQYVMIQGTDDTNTLTVQDQGSLASSNLELGAASRTLGAGDVLVLTFDTTASVWYEVSFANN